MTVLQSGPLCFNLHHPSLVRNGTYALRIQSSGCVHASGRRGRGEHYGEIVGCLRRKSLIVSNPRSPEEAGTGIESGGLLTRADGGRLSLHLAAIRHRFTPTRVGKIWSLLPPHSPPPVHPHARGENGARLLAAGGPARFTPTRVGKILRLYATTSLSFGSPPRAWGKFRSVKVGFQNKYGSPPRAWGKYHLRVDVRVKLRFTPTRVGKILEGAANPLAVRFTPTRVGKIRIDPPYTYNHTVHPHARGENDTPGFRGAPHSGSPPLAWGKCQQRRRKLRADGGSPPRAWGKCQERLNDGARVRFTPTRVGKIWGRASRT